MKKGLFILGVSLAFAYKSAVNNDFDHLCYKYGRRYNIDPMLIKAVIWKESSYNPKAHNTDGEDSRGLMQINYSYHKNLNGKKLFEPDYNVNVGAGMLAEAVKKYGLLNGISYYNAGRLTWKNEDYVAMVITRFLYLKFDQFTNI